MSSKTLEYADHGDVLTQNLASNLRQSTFADVKLICFDGSAWAHRLVLAAVSPVLKTLFLSLEAEEVVTIYLPQLLKSHVSLVLDYVYKGRMYIRPSQLQHVLGVIEVLSLECGVSVSKKVVKHEDSWTEEAVFESFYDKGFQREVCKSLKSDGGEEAAIEVNPIHVHQRRQSQRNSFNDDFKGIVKIFRNFSRQIKVVDSLLQIRYILTNFSDQNDLANFSRKIVLIFLFRLCCSRGYW